MVEREGEREGGREQKKPPIILISLSKLMFAEVTDLFSWLELELSPQASALFLCPAGYSFEKWRREKEVRKGYECR